MPLDPTSDVKFLKGVGPSLVQKLNKLGIFSVLDLVLFFPRAYEDRSEVRLLSGVNEGEKATFRLKVLDHSQFFYNGRYHPKIKVGDASGKALLYCFNRSYLKNLLKPASTVTLTGAFVRRRGVPIFSQFEVEADGIENEPEVFESAGRKDDAAPAPGIVPVYHLTAGLSQRLLRRLMLSALDTLCPVIEEDIPRFIRDGYRISPKGDLIRSMHFPRDMAALRSAREALSYREFFKYQVVAALVRQKNVQVVKARLRAEGNLAEAFLKQLHFQLTGAQKKVLAEIEEDLKRPNPMNRLIQGDVGCGKTIVALLTALRAIEAGGQAAFMAPTEILARQHYERVSSAFDGLGVRSEFLSGAVRGAERKRVLSALSDGEARLAVGTHALFSDDVAFRNLTLVVIDEQQKFGVLQRGSLRSKGEHPDCLVMSATPIPRTLSMTLYGDLDVSIIDEMPAGRAGAETFVVKQAEIAEVYKRVREEVGKGRQAYFIYPIIEESMVADLKNAVDSHERLRNTVFPDFSVGLLHGRMEDEEKEAVMRRFQDRKHHILVSTSVVEVGVDVPNATVMVIEQAERFGLSSIHQLRGRIGRGEHRSYCYLVPDRSTGREAYERLIILRETNDGFKIAEWDLKLRGPGEVLGRRQSGVPSFIIEDFDVNTKLIYRAQRDARAFVGGTIGTEAERAEYLSIFMASDAYKSALLYFGG